MKKVFLLAVAAVISMASYAQVDTKAVGVHLNYGSNNETVGFGIKAQNNFTDNIRGEAQFDLFAKKAGWGMWDLAINGHYLFNITEKFTIYPIVGFTYTNWYHTWEERETTASGTYIREKSDHYSRFGSNFGVGGEYKLTDRLSTYLEVKKQVVSNYDQMMYTLGISMKF